MTTLYELDYNLRQIDSLLSASQDEETLEILEDAKKVLFQDIEEKAVDILTYNSDCIARAKHLKEEADRLERKAKALEKRSEFLKNLLKIHMQNTNQDKATFGIYDVALAKTPDKVVINDDAIALIPNHLCKITRTPDKAAIKALMQDGRFVVNIDGKEVEIAHTEAGKTIRIK